MAGNPLPEEGGEDAQSEAETKGRRGRGREGQGGEDAFRRLEDLYGIRDRYRF